MKTAILGSGTWGTALAQVLTDNGEEVLLYGRNPDQVRDINENHRNSRYFGEDVALSDGIRATDDLAEAVKDADIVVLSVPSASMKTVLREAAPFLAKPAVFINTAKGFDPETRKRLSLVIEETIPEEKRKAVVSLIGPSHAEEVVVRDLTCVCAVTEDKDTAFSVARIFSNSYFRVYANTDVIGSEIGAAMKNCIAIASGVLEGLGYSDNARAALYSRGLAEMTRFGIALGGKPETFLGLTGAGDLAVTCYSFHSRNFMAGLSIGKADSAAEFLKSNTKTVEGIRTTAVIHDMSLAMGIELPIVNAVYSVLFLDATPSSVTAALMNRPLKAQ